MDWLGRPFLRKEVNRHLHSDSCTHRWVGIHFISRVDDKVFISVRRKQQRRELFEQVMMLPRREISPQYLSLQYVRLTVKEGKPGGPLLLPSYKTAHPADRWYSAPPDCRPGSHNFFPLSHVGWVLCSGLFEVGFILL